MSDAFLEHQRRRFMRPDAHRYRRPDAQRWLKPQARQRLLPDSLRSDWTTIDRKHESDQRRLSDALRAEWAELHRLKLLHAELKLQIALSRLARKYSPDQPRVPAGNPDGGQWTSEGAGSSLPRLYAAGMPRIPPLRPPTSPERTAVMKAVAVWLAERGIAAAEAIAKTSWLYHAIPSISSYLDAPKSLEELQQAALEPPKLGYQDHHIVEQSSAALDGFPAQRIDASDNIVRVPTMKHWEINAWYQRSNESFGWVSPRGYLRGKDWDERRRIGLDALVLFGVLEP